MGKTKSGNFWVTWANAHAKNSTSVDDLVEPFKANAKAFIKALEDAGATVYVTTTKRSAQACLPVPLVLEDRAWQGESLRSHDDGRR